MFMINCPVRIARFLGVTPATRTDEEGLTRPTLTAGGTGPSGESGDGQ